MGSSALEQQQIIHAQRPTALNHCDHLRLARPPPAIAVDRQFASTPIILGSPGTQGVVDLRLGDRAHINRSIAQPKQPVIKGDLIAVIEGGTGQG